MNHNDSLQGFKCKERDNKDLAYYPVLWKSLIIDICISWLGTRTLEGEPLTDLNKENTIKAPVEKVAQ